MDRKFKAIRNYKDLEILNGLAFEEYLCQLFAELGFEAKRTSASGDYGCDLVLRDGKKKIVVQAKQYVQPVGIEAVQQVHFAKTFYKAKEAWVVCTHDFTKAAVTSAKKCNVKLINGPMLNQYIKDARNGRRLSDGEDRKAEGRETKEERVFNSLRILWVYDSKECDGIELVQGSIRSSISNRAKLIKVADLLLRAKAPLGRSFLERLAQKNKYAFEDIERITNLTYFNPNPKDKKASQTKAAKYSISKAELSRAEKIRSSLEYARDKLNAHKGVIVPDPEIEAYIADKGIKIYEKESIKEVVRLFETIGILSRDASGYKLTGKTIYGWLRDLGAEERSWNKKLKLYYEGID